MNRPHPGEDAASLYKGGAGKLLVIAMAALALCLFLASFFLDGLIRPRLISAMNRKLIGYRVTLSHAHLQLLGGRLTLTGLQVTQQRHPQPPVADFRILRFDIQWLPLLSGHVAAEIVARNPSIYINTAQLAAEYHDKVSLRKKGWQQALENAYPFKINRLRIVNGDVTYLDAAKPDRPLHLEHLDLTAANISNLNSSKHPFPSSVRAEAVVFGEGHLTLNGRANFMLEPFAGVRMHYRIKGVPLDALDPASSHLNLILTGGTLTSEGRVEYTPTRERVEVLNGVIDGLNVGYTHMGESERKEAGVKAITREHIRKENNHPGTLIEVHRLDLTHATLAYTYQAPDTHYRLFITNADVRLANFSNQAQEGAAHATLRGNFMGSGITDANGEFLPSKRGPQFNVNVAIRNTELNSMNDLLRSYGKFGVKAGLLSVYSQIAVDHGNVKGYVKPMFADLQIYNRQQDKNKSLTKKAYEMTLQTAAKLLKNTRTQKVATKVDITGKLDKPNTSTLQALIEIVRNAFIKAILPGFDRQASQAPGQ